MTGLLKLNLMLMQKLTMKYLSMVLLSFLGKELNLTKRIKSNGGDEYDALNKRTRKYYMWGRGQLKKIKRGYNKRFRKSTKVKCDE